MSHPLPTHPPAVRADATLHVVSGPRPGGQVQAWQSALAGCPDLMPEQLVWHHARHGRHLDVLAAAVVQRARQDGGIVVACGGDGTLNTVARHCWPLGVPMAVLPLGTFNYFSREHDLGSGPASAIGRIVEALRQGRCMPVPVGLLNDEVFVVNASLGLYPRLLAEREAASAQLGRSRWVALWSGLRSIWSAGGGTHLRLQARSAATAATTTEAPLPTGRELREVAALFIGNNPLQLQHLGFGDEHALGPDQDHLAALMFAPQPRATMLRMLVRALLGRLPDEPAIERFAFSELHIEGRQRVAPQRIRVALDGEPRWMTLPLRCVRAARPLWLVNLPDQRQADAVEEAQPQPITRSPLAKAA